MIDGRWLREQQRLLVARHGRRLGQTLAEDLASEATARCLQSPAPDGRHGPWLGRIFGNLVIDHFRRARADDGSATAEPLRSMPLTPEEELLRRERQQILVHAWQTVAPEQRAAIEARINDEEDRSQRLRDVAPETLRTRVHRGLTTLRRAVSRLGVQAPSWLSTAFQSTATATLSTATLVLLVAAPPRTTPLNHTTGVLAQKASSAPRSRVSGQREEGTSPKAPGTSANTATSAANVTANPQRPATTAKPQSFPAIRRFDFDTDELTGDLQRPDDELVQGPAARTPQSSLIEIPSSFVPAIVRSLEDL